MFGSAANAQDTVKIGIINEYSGQFADTGNQIDNGIKLYVKQHGDTVAGKKIELIRKDTGGMAPDVSKRLRRRSSSATTPIFSPVSRSRRMRSPRPTSPPKPRNSWWS